MFVCPHLHLKASIQRPGLATHIGPHLGHADTQPGSVIGAGTGATDIPRGDRILYPLGFEKTENGY